MMIVFLVEHSYRHGECVETKTIGIYSSEENAKAAIDRLRRQPGFSDWPESFFIHTHELDVSKARD